MSKIVTFGEILLRLSPPSHLRLTQATSFDLYYGCAEANVAASLAKFGFPVKFITSVPANELGESALSMLRSFGVEPVAKIQGKRLGIYYFEQGASERPGKVVYDREDSSFSMLRKGMIDWEKAFEGADWFHWSGITPSLSLELAELCEEALEVADRIVVISKGKIEQIGTPEEVFHNPANEFVINFLGNVNLFHGREEDGRLNIDSSLENQDNNSKFLIRPHELEIVSVNDKEAILQAKVRYIQLAGSQVKVELTHLENEAKTVLVEISHYEFKEKNISKGDIVGIRPRAVRTFEDGAGI